MYVTSVGAASRGEATTDDDVRQSYGA